MYVAVKFGKNVSILNSKKIFKKNFTYTQIPIISKIKIGHTLNFKLINKFGD